MNSLSLSPCPARAKPDNLPKPGGVSTVGRTEIRRVFAVLAPPLPPCPMRSVQPDPANPGSVQSADRRLCPISRRGSKIPLVGRVGGTAILTALPDPRNSYRIVNSSVRGAPALPRSLFSLRRSPTLGCRYQFTTETRRLHGGPTSSVDSVSPWRIFPQGQSIQQETHEQRGALPTSRRRTDKRGLRGLDRTAAGT